MPKITFTDTSGETRVVDIATGGSLMEAAVAHQIAGIDGDCGGACACATCHVHVAAEVFAALPPADDMETSMLEFAENPTEHSRLACQIMVTDDLEGAHFVVPEG